MIDFGVDMLTIDEIKNTVMDGLLENYRSDYEITPRIISTFSSAIKNFIDKGKIEESIGAIDKVLHSDITKDFVRSKQPLIEKVSDEVIYNVYNYLANSKPALEVYSIARASNVPDDNYLYSVICRDKTDGEFVCWTSWNESTKSLNHGHYNCGDFKNCHKIISDNFNDMTDDIVKYGPDASIVMLTEEQRQELHDKREEQQNSVEDITSDKLVSMEEVVNRHRRGR